MRIAFAMINCNRRDGSARAVNEVAERLARRGHDVHLYARKAEDLDLALVHWHRVPGPSWPEVADFWSYHHAANALLRGTRYEIIHSIGPNTSRANVVTIQNIQPAKREILRRHAGEEAISPFRRFTRALYLQVTSNAERHLYTRRPGPLFLPVSRGVENELRTHYDIGPSPVRIVPNAADTGIFHPVPEPERLAWRRANGLDEADAVCLFSGGEWARKGLDLAILALARIPQPGAKLFVAGDDADRERFKRLAFDHGLGDRVIFGGFRKDMAAAMAAADLFLFPSHYEAFSLATIEAAACGLPIIASRINGTEDFIQPGENGEFVPHDPEGIAAVLTPLLQNRSAMQAMGEAGRRLVEARYTWDRVAALTEEAYQSIRK